MFSPDLNPKSPSVDIESKKKEAIRMVAATLGYGDVKLLLQKSRIEIRDRVIKMLQDYAETSDILENDKKTIAQEQGLGSMNEEFIDLYHNALEAGFIEEDDLKEIYPAIPGNK